MRVHDVTFAMLAHLVTQALVVGRSRRPACAPRAAAAADGCRAAARELLHRQRRGWGGRTDPAAGHIAKQRQLVQALLPARLLLLQQRCLDSA